jgi:hypothetical protein
MRNIFHHKTIDIVFALNYNSSRMLVSVKVILSAPVLHLH